MDSAKVVACCALVIACWQNVGGQSATAEPGVARCDAQGQDGKAGAPQTPWPAYVPPLDTSVLYNRALTPETVSKPGTHELISLVMDVNKENGFGFGVYPWPLFIQITSNYDSGDAVGVNVVEQAKGANWETGYHVESTSDAGTKIGYNAEMRNEGNARVIGLNLQSKRGNTADANIAADAVNIQTDPGAAWETGIHFDGATVRTGVDFDIKSSGERAIWVQGNYPVALDAGDGAIRMHSGAPLELDHSNQIAILYDQEHSRILFKKSGRVLVYIDTTKVTQPVPLN